jgi:preprotein translocase subunit SecG
LTRTTWILGTSFFVISLLLTILAGREKGASSIVDRMKIDSLDPALLQNQKAKPPAGTAQPGGPQSAPAPLQAPAPQINNPFLGQQAPTAPAAPPPK